MKSKHWAKLRVLMLKNHPVCIHCQEEKNGLQVHHLHYETIGNENPDIDLCVLCDACHKLIHLANFIPIMDIAPKQKRKIREQRTCLNCKFHGFLKYAGKNGKKLHCRYYDKINPDKPCSKHTFPSSGRIRVYTSNIK